MKQAGVLDVSATRQTMLGIGGMMKALNLVLLASLLTLLTGVAAAQVSSNPPDAPDVTVAENSWRKEVRNPALDDPSFRAIPEPGAAERSTTDAIRETTRNPDGRVKVKQGPNPASTRADTLRNDSDRLITEYIYKVKINNTGMKTIRELVWEYVLVDPDTRREVGHHQFTSDVNIQPGKTKNLSGSSRFPPASIVDAKNVRDDSPGQYSERVVIHRITYEDGSVWKRTSN